LLIEDNGSGFDPDSIQWIEGQCRGLGLLGMRKRASLSGGLYHLDSAPGKGTRIKVSWSCEETSLVPDAYRCAHASNPGQAQLHSSPT